MSMMAMPALSQKQSVVKTQSYSNSQARMVEATAKTYVKPLVADMKVIDPTRLVFVKKYPRDVVETGMNGSADNLRARVVYDAAAQYNCDAIVAATFKIELLQQEDAYEVEMRGFKANFENWHPLSKDDYEWIRIEKDANDLRLNDPNRAGAVISNVRR